jgi:hypothetical protein
VSTLKSSAENLTLNADGSGNDIKFQSNAVEKASIDQDGNLVLSGNLTSTGIDDNADATAITINSAEQVTIDSTAAADTLTLNRDGGTNGWATLGFPTAKFEIDAKAAMKVAVDGTQKLYLTTAGLAFNSDTAAANSLNDYEEGTFTPTLNDGRSITYSAQEGHYTKIGRQVFWHLKLQWTGRSGSTQTYVYLAALPFTVGTSTDGYIAIAPAFWNNPAQGAYQVGCDAAQNSTVASFTYNATGTSGSSRVHCLSNQLNDTGMIKASGSYFTT